MGLNIHTLEDRNTEYSPHDRTHTSFKIEYAKPTIKYMYIFIYTYILHDIVRNTYNTVKMNIRIYLIGYDIWMYILQNKVYSSLGKNT